LLFHGVIAGRGGPVASHQFVGSAAHDEHVCRLKCFHGVGVKVIVHNVPVDFAVGSFNVAVDGNGHLENDLFHIGVIIASFGALAG
jgi:hypothetical protein